MNTLSNINTTYNRFKFHFYFVKNTRHSYGYVCVLFLNKLKFIPDSKISFEIRNGINPKNLAKIHHQEIKIDRPLSKLEDILTNEDKRTVSGFCDYISKHTKRTNIDSIRLLGQNCQTVDSTLKCNTLKKDLFRCLN